ncbi:hypothetical protein AWENTII_009810 [Aspergillus wentii]
MLILTILLGCWMQLVMDSIDEKLLRSCSTGDLSSIATLLANHAPSSEAVQEMMCKAVYSALSDQPPADWLNLSTIYSNVSPTSASQRKPFAGPSTRTQFL